MKLVVWSYLFLFYVESVCIVGRRNKMAPLDWDQLMKINLEQLQNDTAQADELYNVLADVGLFLFSHTHDRAVQYYLRFR